MQFANRLGLTLAALAVSALPAMAADLGVYRKAKPAAPVYEPWWEIAYGGALMSDYNFRGVSQSDRSVAGTVYSEGRANLIKDVLQVYGGIQAWTTRLPTNPTGEVDFYAGIRPTFGQFAFDFGAMYYYYPREAQQFFADPTLTSLSETNFGLGAFTVANTDFWEVYGKVTWNVHTQVALGAYVYYAPNLLGSGAEGTYVGGTAKLSAPANFFPADYGAYVSAELAHYWIGNFTALGAPFDLPDYTYWNVGVGATYKVFTFDLRYHDTDLSQEQCFAFTGDPRGLTNGGRSRWCGEAFIAKLSFDATLK